jgi:membrane protease YdiL (CAAX protease family)
MENKVYPTIKNSILLCLLFLGIQIGLGLLIGFSRVIFHAPDIALLTGVITALSNIISFGIVLLIGFKKTKRKFNEVFKFNKVSPFLWIAVVVFMFGFVILTSELDNLLNFILPMPELFKDALESLMADQIFFVAIIVMGVVPAFTEELFFRGLILDGLNSNYSRKKAIIISALLFGIVHLNPWQFLSAFIIGLFAAWICIKTNSILLCIYIHLFNNSLYTVVVKYNNIISIKGFNSNNITPVEFQPIWFDLIGLVIFIFGIILLKKGFEERKTDENTGFLYK